MSFFTLQNTINWARTFVQYAPVTAGFGNEPAISIASMIRNSLLSAPMTWPWNRNETTFQTVVGTQDYTETLSDFGFIEKVMMTDDQGSIWTVRDVYNNQSLPVSAVQGQPSAVAAELVVTGTSVKFRFLPVPEQIYTVTVTYQKLAPQFGAYFATSVIAASGGDTSYLGSFDPYSLPVGSYATITGFNQTVNNGTFQVVAVSSTELTVVNANGVNESDITGYVTNFAWSPVPDAYSDIYNNLFLAEIFNLADEPQKTQMYRQRGVAAFLAKASGLTEMQKSAWMQQWLQSDAERITMLTAAQQGIQARGV